MTPCASLNSLNLILHEDSVEFQLREYGDWANRVLANNVEERLNLCIIGKGFSKGLLNQKEIKLVKYSIIDEEPYLLLEKLNF
jgi:hypothetical protein